jgi:uncharacterized membrane protein
MPSIAAYHPHIVHFVVALLVVGVLLRLVSLTGRLLFTSHAATTLILLGTLASLVAVASGNQAAVPVEQIPGALEAVERHSSWAVWVRNLFILVSLLELGALGLAWRQHQYARYGTMAAAVVGLIGLLVLYQAADAGGNLVYSHAGGVGIRSGDPEDVNRLVIAGVFHQAMQDREAGNALASDELVSAAARRFPNHLELQLFTAEWQLEVRNDPAGAITRLDSLPLAQAEPRARIRAGLTRANALVAQGNLDGARAVLQTLRTENPDDPRIAQRLSELGQ